MYEALHRCWYGKLSMRLSLFIAGILCSIMLYINLIHKIFFSHSHTNSFLKILKILKLWQFCFACHFSKILKLQSINFWRSGFRLPLKILYHLMEWRAGGTWWYQDQTIFDFELISSKRKAIKKEYPVSEELPHTTRNYLYNLSICSRYIFIL